MLVMAYSPARRTPSLLHDPRLALVQHTIARQPLSGVDRPQSPGE